MKGGWCFGFFLLIVSCYFDLRYRTIPNFITIPAIIWGFLIAFLNDRLLEAILGALLGAIVSLPALLMGSGGDFKIAIALGALWGRYSPTFFLISLLAALLFMLILRKKSAPWAPFLLLAHILWGVR